MMAVALDNFQIMVVDLDTRRVVRKFQGHSNKVTGLSFSPDARWLISSAMDCTVRTWDLPSGRYAMKKLYNVISLFCWESMLSGK
jgi:U3 small nucleolar RNA-associated protein 21